MSPANYNKGFFTLPYYSFSSKEDYIDLHFSHNFKGFVLDKIPLLKKLGFEMVAGVSFLEASDRGRFMEWNVGIDNIGIHIIRPLRLDYVQSFYNGRIFNSGFRLGLRAELGN